MEILAISRLLAAQLGGDWTLRRLAASGFCATWQARCGDRLLFVKAGQPALLEAEADGLQALAAAGAVRVPRVMASGAGLLALE